MSTITLTSYLSSLNGGNVVLTLNGTVTGCNFDTLYFKITCHDNPPIYASTQQTAGNWSLTVQTACVCTDRIQIEAQCADEGYHQVVNGNIPPNSAPACCCPTLQLSKITQGECDAQGNRSVSFDYTITPSANDSCPDITGVLTISPYGVFPGQSIPISTGNLNGFLTLPALPAGHTYTITLTLTSPVYCPPVQAMLPVEPCDDCCPQVHLIYSLGDCDPETGERPVIFTYSITPSPNSDCLPVQASLQLPDTPVIPIQLTSTAPFSDTIIVLCPPGLYSASLIVIQPGGCAGKTIQIPVPPSCPTTAMIKRKVRECDPEFDKRHMLVKADIESPCGDAMEASLEVEGIAIASGSGPSPLTLVGEGDFTCGHHPVTVKVTGCPDIHSSICVPACESEFCKFKRRVLLAAIGSAAILWILFALHAAVSGTLFWVIPVQNILLWYAVIATILAVFVFIAWLPCLKKCRKCKLWLLAWQIALVVWCGIFYFIKGFFLYFVEAYVISSFWLYLLLILILVIVLILLLWLVYSLFQVWRFICCPQKCTVIGELAMAFLVGFGSALTTALTIPEIVHDFVCNPIAFVAAIFLIIIVSLALSCEQPDEWE